uniref:Uncharacterized protein n=1 Tax=Arundo donax TaxID=35708 RepID=A0A0A8ZIR4_ARUDO
MYVCTVTIHTGMHGRAPCSRRSRTARIRTSSGEVLPLHADSRGSRAG